MKKPRMLITGMNNLQSTYNFHLRQELGVVPTQYSLIKCLEDMGWEVEQRYVKVGEDISGYDEVIVYLHSPKAYAQALWSGMYAIYARPDCIVSIDDWQFTSILASLRSYLVGLETDEKGTAGESFKDYFMSLYRGTETVEELIPWRDRFAEGLRNVLTGRNRFLVAGWQGGDMTKTGIIWSPERTFRFDPNPYHMNRTPENNFGNEFSLDSFFASDVKKSRSWVFASLVKEKTIKWLDKQNSDWKWPILQFGARRGKYKDRRVKEDEMCRIYHENWGCLAPAYYHAGSGFWRPRVLQVADAGSILVVDDAEGAVYSEAHVGVRPADVELMDDTQLANLAKAQKEALYDKHPLDKSRTRVEIQSILDAPK